MYTPSPFLKQACVLLSEADCAIYRGLGLHCAVWFELHSLSVLDFMHGYPHTGQQSLFSEYLMAVKRV